MREHSALLARGRAKGGIIGAAAAGAILLLVGLVGVGRLGGGAVPAERMQVLAIGDAFDARPPAPAEVEYLGDIPVDDVLDNGLMDRPAVDVEHALCNKDTDPDCETSISPFVDKSRGRQVLVQRKAREQSLIMPWYEVASTGDGMGPETVTYWKLPPKAQMMQAQKANAEELASDQIDTTAKPKAKAAALGGFPAPPNTYQEPTVWKGDHVLNGGNKEWAEEDAALHAYNMQRWRNKIIGEQIDRQRSQWDLMNEADWCDCNCGARGNGGWEFKGARGTCGHTHNSCGCSGQPGCGCTNNVNQNWNGGHSPGNSAHDHSTASQNTDYGYHSSNSESGRGVHVTVTGHGHSVTVNGHSASDFGGGVVNSDGDGGYGYGCHSCHDIANDWHGRYHRRRGSRSSADAPVLVDGEVPKELLDREGGSAALAGAGDERKRRVAANLRALADDADKELALLDDASPAGVDAEMETTEEMTKMLKRIEEEETRMREDAAADQYPQSEDEGLPMSAEQEEEQQERQ